MAPSAAFACALRLVPAPAHASAPLSGAPSQDEAPYLTALREYAGRSPGRYHVPGHKGGLAADGELRGALGAGALALDLRVSRGLRSRPASAVGPPPSWGPVVMTPREAFLGPQETVSIDHAVGRVAAESVPAYPPGIPNVFPGERLTRPTLRYIQRTLDQGGNVRGLCDRSLRTIRVAIED